MAAATPPASGFALHASKQPAPKTLAERFEQFLVQHHLEALRHILKHSDTRTPHSIHVCAIEFAHALPQLANAVLARPTTSMGVLDEAARAAQEIVRVRMVEDLRKGVGSGEAKRRRR